MTTPFVVTQFLVIGVAAALLIEPSITRRRLLGTAYLLGTGICAFLLLALSLLGIAWSPIAFIVVFNVVAIALWVVILRRRLSPLAPRSSPFMAIDLVTALVVIAHAAYALMVAGDEWDFWAIWGLKGRVFFENRGIDWAFLQHPYNEFAHPDYPLLLPLHYASAALIEGAWSERPIGLFTTFFGAALLLIVRDLFEEEIGPRAASFATLAVASMSLAPVGMADTPMIAFGTAGLLSIRRGSFGTGSVLLGLAAFTKNEGVALIVAAVMALLLTRGWRAALRIWPALLVAAPWLIIRATLNLQTDVFAGSVTERLAGAAARLAQLLPALAEFPPHPVAFWIAIAIALILCARALEQERFVLAALVLQLAIYLAVYIVSPRDLRWHVATSWSRLMQHTAVGFAFVTLVLAGRAIGRTRDG